MNTPSSATPSVYFDAPTIPSASLDMSDQIAAPTNGDVQHEGPHTDVKHAPEPSTSANTDPSPEYAHNNTAVLPEKPTVDTNVTGEPTVMSPDGSSLVGTPHHVATSHERAATAESSMTNEAKAKVAKNEGERALRQ
jgi:hypothetical protein